MRLTSLSVLTLLAFALSPANASAMGEWRLTPPRLLDEGALEGPRLAQDYDAAFDDEEESSPPQKRRRNRSSGSTQRASSSSSSYGGGGGVAPMGKTFGIGLQVGAPTAVTGKFMLTPESGLVVGLGAGYGFFFDPALSVHVDYLYHPSVLFQNEGVKLSWFIGGGGWLGVFQGHRSYRQFVVTPLTYGVYGSPLFLAARIPIGLDLALQSIPLELYLEGVPAINVFPVITFGIGVAAGARFYF